MSRSALSSKCLRLTASTLSTVFLTSSLKWRTKKKNSSQWENASDSNFYGNQSRASSASLPTLKTQGTGKIAWTEFFFICISLHKIKNSNNLTAIGTNSNVIVRDPRHATPLPVSKSLFTGQKRTALQETVKDKITNSFLNIGIIWLCWGLDFLINRPKNYKILTEWDTTTVSLILYVLQLAESTAWKSKRFCFGK